MTQEFISYLESLAPENETFLIVLQKPILKDGQQQAHKDGAVKCTWPAMMPSKWKPGRAWYGNTGSFIIDRFKNGKPSASAVNCEYALVLVLDDIGTKSKAPPLLPTWIMETSPGNYQWGYAFSEGARKAEFAAAVIAIAAAGYTDKGAINPVRNFRLPGSINLKPGKDNFESRLVEFHPDREYTLEQICTALDVVPALADTASHKPIDLLDDGNDVVQRWLMNNGQALEAPNGSGWMGVVCPNASEHSDGNPMGRYHPVNRAYCCLHAHCCDWGSQRYLEWVAGQGGPVVSLGSRDELVSEKMSSVMLRLVETKAEQGSQFSEASAAEAEIKRIDQRQQGRIEQQHWHDRYAYLVADNAFFDLEQQTCLSRASFDALYRHVDCRSVHGKAPKALPSASYDELRVQRNSTPLQSMTYSAGDGPLVARDGLVYGNRWRNARPAAKGQDGADIGRWLKLWERLLPGAGEREHIWNVLAYKLQNPKVKINHAILLAGGQGIGKDTLMMPFLWAVGGPDHKNVKTIDNDQLTSRWGYALEAEVIVINELRQSEAKDRRALENRIKPIVAAPPLFLSVELKGIAPYEIPNRALVIAYSNERSAIALSNDDRRWFVTWSSAPPMSGIDAASLHAWYRSGGYEAIAEWLASRDVSAFNPGAAPARTEAKDILMDGGRSAGEAYILDLIESRTGEFAKGAIVGPFLKLLDRLQAGFDGRLYRGDLEHALKAAQWDDLGLVKTRESPSRRHLFAAPGMIAEYSRSDLRRMAEEPIAPSLKIVGKGLE